MKTASNLTRREALLAALKVTVVASLAAPALTQAEEPQPPEPEFVPENDYPCFGYEPESPE